jgi:tetratricopeptide (TPR) repeat protein
MPKGYCGEQHWSVFLLNIVGAGILILSFLTAPGAVIAQEPAIDGLDEVRMLLEQGRPEAAYARALALEPELIGEPAFDFYLGLAAIESGRAAVAALAFERVLITEPGSARVELELARALFELGDLDGAQVRFIRVLDQTLPEGVQVTINRFLAAIERRRKRQSRQYHWGVSLAGGHDSNINSATSADEFEFALGTVIFPQESQQREDIFLSLGAFFNANARVGSRSRLFFNS